MRLINRRLEAVESRMPPAPETSAWAPLLPFLTVAELERLSGFDVGGPPPPTELQRIGELAIRRHGAGLSPADVQEKFAHPQGQVVGRFWRFILALQNRHDCKGLPASQHWDTLDLTLADVDELTRLTLEATTIAEIEAATGVVEKLWLDGEPLNVERFVAIVLRGEYNPPIERRERR